MSPTLQRICLLLLFDAALSEILIIDVADYSVLDESRDLSYGDSLISYLIGWKDVEYTDFNQSLSVVARKINITNGYQIMSEVCSLITGSQTYSAIVAVSCESASYVVSMLERMRIPSVYVIYGSCDLYEYYPDVTTTSFYSRPIRVERTPAIKIIENLILVRGWNKLVIFYDKINGGGVYADMLFSCLSSLNTTAAVYELDSDMSDDKLSEVLSSVKPRPDYILPYVMFTSDNVTKRVLTKAKAFQMRTLENRWLLLGALSDQIQVESLLDKEDNIAIISRAGTAAMLEHAIFEIKESVKVIQLAYDELDISQDWTDRTRESSTCQTSVSPKLHRVLARNIQEHMRIEFYYNITYDEYRVMSSTVKMDDVPTLTEVAVWTSEKEFEFREDLYPNSFNGFNNRKFRVASLEYSFFQQKIRQPDGTFKWVGLTFTILDELAKDLNFRYEVVEPPDMLWGIKTDNGTWNGMIAMVLDKSVDFAAAGFSVTADRESVVDFAQPYFYERSAVIIKRPQHEKKVTLYLKPFKWQVWASCVCAIFLYAVLLWIMTKYNPSQSFNTKKRELEYGGSRIKNTILYFFGCLMQQGGVWLPRSQSGRILVGCFWFFSIVIVATYTGNLIAFLAVNSVTLPFNTLSEMVKQSKIEWGPCEGVAMIMLFRDAKVEPYTSVYRNMKPVGSYSEGLRRVTEGDYAFIAEKSWYQAEVSKDCSLAMIKETFYPTNYAWAFPTDAPIIKIFNDRFNKMRESGLLTHWTKKWTPQALNCTGLKPVTNAKTVDLTDFQGALYILGVGLFISAVVLIFELAQTTKKASCLKHSRDYSRSS